MVPELSPLDIETVDMQIARVRGGQALAGLPSISSDDLRRDVANEPLPSGLNSPRRDARRGSVDGAPTTVRTTSGQALFSRNAVSGQIRDSLLWYCA